MSADLCRFIADRGDEGRRLDQTVCRHLASLRVSRTRVQRWIAAGLVHVNGCTWQRAAARMLRTGQDERRPAVARMRSRFLLTCSTKTMTCSS